MRVVYYRQGLISSWPQQATPPALSFEEERRFARRWAASRHWTSERHAKPHGAVGRAVFSQRAPWTVTADHAARIVLNPQSPPHGTGGDGPTAAGTAERADQISKVSLTPNCDPADQNDDVGLDSGDPEAQGSSSYPTEKGGLYMERWIAQANVARLKAKLTDGKPHDNRPELLRQLAVQEELLRKIGAAGRQ